MSLKQAVAENWRPGKSARSGRLPSLLELQDLLVVKDVWLIWVPTVLALAVVSSLRTTIDRR